MKENDVVYKSKHIVIEELPNGVFRKHSDEYKFSIVNLKDYC